MVGSVPWPWCVRARRARAPAAAPLSQSLQVGEGPFYCFYTRYHLCHFEVPNTIARAVEFGDPTIAPAEGPMVDVVATAKTDLEEGTVIDGIGGYLTYGQCENVGHRSTPMGCSRWGWLRAVG